MNISRFYVDSRPDRVIRDERRGRSVKDIFRSNRHRGLAISTPEAFDGIIIIIIIIRISEPANIRRFLRFRPKDFIICRVRPTTTTATRTIRIMELRATCSLFERL